MLYRSSLFPNVTPVNSTLAAVGECEWSEILLNLLGLDLASKSPHLPVFWQVGQVARAIKIFISQRPAALSDAHLRARGILLGHMLSHPRGVCKA